MSILLVMFFRQKVTLWQHADELEEEQQRMGKWVNSKGVTECMECGTAFTLLTRKVSSYLPLSLWTLFTATYASVLHHIPLSNCCVHTHTHTHTHNHKHTHTHIHTHTHTPASLSVMWEGLL